MLATVLLLVVWVRWAALLVATCCTWLLGLGGCCTARAQGTDLQQSRIIQTGTGRVHGCWLLAGLLWHMPLAGLLAMMN